MATQAVVPQSQPRALSVEAQQDIDGFRALQYAAGIMAKSGCFSDIKGVDESTAIAKAVVKIAIGRDYGFSVAESMQHIELIQGRPSIAAHARAAKMKAAGYSWKFVKFDATECNVVVFSPDGEELGDSIFTMEDAKKMGLAGKDNWQKNPRNMLYCRAISNAQRWYAPEVLSAALVSKEEIFDGDYSSAAPIAAPERAVVTIDAFTPSADENRGHDATVEAQADVVEPEVQVIWPDAAAMKVAFSAERKRIGHDEWDRLLGEYSVMMGSAKPTDENVIRCFMEMQKRPAKDSPKGGPIA